MRRVATISAAKMALCVINIIPPAWAQDRPDVVDRSTEDTNHHVSQQTTWPQFRGHLGRSVSRASNIPLEWSSDNVMWRASTPSFGQSSPVIWNDTVFLTSIEGASKETLWISALRLTDGKEQWRRAFLASEQHEFNDYVSKAAPTPAVDEERVYALFASGDLYAVTHAGDVAWHRDLSTEYGSFGGNHGVGSSVILTPQAVVVFLARRDYSYLLSIERTTGDTLWKTDRKAGVAWTTPTLSPDGHEIIVSASGQVQGFNSDTGQLLWTFEGLTGNNVPSPSVTENLVITGGLGVEANLALRRGEKGQLANPSIAWRADSASNFGSPLVYTNCAYWVNPAGVARCLDIDTGVRRWIHRLPSSVWATPLGYKDYVYFFGTNGVTEVLRATADGPHVVATNHISVSAPVTGYAVVDGAIVVRAGREIIRIGPGNYRNHASINKRVPPHMVWDLNEGTRFKHRHAWSVPATLQEYINESHATTNPKGTY